MARSTEEEKKLCISQEWAEWEEKKSLHKKNIEIYMITT